MKRNYYFFTKGKLRRKNSTICFEPSQMISPQEDENLQNDILLENCRSSIVYNSPAARIIPIADVEAIYIMADVVFNSKFIEFASSNKIPIHYFNYYGAYKGTFYPPSAIYSGAFIIQQCSFYLKPSRRLFIAQKILEASLNNLLYNIKRSISRGFALEEEHNKIKELMDSVQNTKDVSELLGIEGLARKTYYDSFNKFLQTEIKFTKRDYHPPKDPMNALISFGNSLVYCAVISEIYQTKLNPFISFLHEPSDRRFSLALDLAEIFKPILADRIIFKLLNRKIITPNNFRYIENACYLDEEGRKKMVDEFDKKLNKIIIHKIYKREISYRRLIRIECYNLINHINKTKEYQPLKIWW